MRHQPPPRTAKTPPGQFAQQRARHQHQGARDACLRDALQHVRRGECPWITLDGLRVQLTADRTQACGDGYYTRYALIRTHTRGLRLAALTEKDQPYATLLGHDAGRTLHFDARDERAYVTAFEPPFPHPTPG